MKQKGFTLPIPLVVIALVVIVAIGACLVYVLTFSYQNEDTSTTTTTSEDSDTSDTSETSDPSRDQISYEIIKEGRSSSVSDKKENVVVTDQARWSEIWQRIESETLTKTDPPTIDFEKESVVAIFAGSKSHGGTSIEITSIFDSDDKIQFIGTIFEAGKDCLTTQAFESPHLLVKVNKPNADVIFDIAEVEIDC